MDPHVTERLSAYMDGELREPERALVEAHLRGCAACARHLEELRAVDAAARALPLDVPDGYFEAFPGRLRRRLERARPAPRRLAPAWIGAAAAAVVLALLTPRLLREPRARVAAPVPAPVPTLAGRDAAPPPPPLASKPDSTVAGEGTRAPRAEAPAPAGGALRKLADRARPLATPPAPAPAGPPAAAPPAANAAPTDTDEVAALGYAAAPAEAGKVEPQAQARREAEFSEAREEQKERRDKAAKAARGVAATQGRVAGSPSSDPRFELLLRRTVSSAAEARALRDSWRAYAREVAAGPHGDEARVRAIEAGAEAWRRGKDERDRAQAQKEGREYLERPDALQADRVRDVLRSLSP